MDFEQNNSLSAIRVGRSYECALKRNTALSLARSNGMYPRPMRALAMSGRGLRWMPIPNSFPRSSSASAICTMSESQYVCSVGYLASVLGLFLTLKTYALFRHGEDVLAKLEIIARQVAAGQEQSRAILENTNSGWKDDKKLGTYRHTKLESRDS